MGVWRDLYGPRNQDFIDGVRAGVKMYAVWNDGVERVGVLGQQLKGVLDFVQEDLTDKPEKPELQKPSCYQCIYRRPLPGDVHSKCFHPKIKGSAEDPLTNVLGIMASVGRTSPLPLPHKNPLNIRGSEHGIKKGWFNWPVNFDPVWLLSCDGFYPKNSPPSTFMSFEEAEKKKTEGR